MHLALSAQGIIGSFLFGSSENTIRVNQRKSNKISGSLYLTSVKLDAARNLVLSSLAHPIGHRDASEKKWVDDTLCAAYLSSISASAVEAGQELLEGIHSKSLCFGCCHLKGIHGLHLTTIRPEWMSVTHCICGQILHEVKIAPLQFFFLCSLYTSWRDAKL